MKAVATLLLYGLSMLSLRPTAEAASPQDAARPERWPDFQIIMWQHQTPARLAGLARLGITAGSILGVRGRIDPASVAAETAPFRALDLRWYVENIATDFYSAYHRWFPDRPVTWLFDEAKRLHRRDPADIRAFVRTPSLSDPAWLARITERLGQHVLAFGDRPRPLFYNLADEAGTGDLAAAWDFDFAPESLVGMRAWLRTRYGSLAALNREWGSRFAAWSAVVPMTTDQALARTDGNLAAWADFKEWMDVAFSRAVRAGTNAVHAADPGARAALEGGQIPGWGGYDYSRLTSAVDVMEMYDFGNNIEIARSLDPRLVVLQTSSVSDPKSIHAIWHGLLLGERGLILWDQNGAFVGDDGAASERGRTLGSLAAGLEDGLAAQLIASRPAADPVAILYSPASLRVQWLLDRKARGGPPWAERDAQAEYDDDNPVRAATRRAASLCAHLGVAVQWLTDDLIAQGALDRLGIRVLVLPHTLALSPAAAQAIRRFAARSGTVLADIDPGAFDAHARRLARPSLAGLAATSGTLLQASDDQASLVEPMGRLLRKVGAQPRFSLRAPDGGLVRDVQARSFRAGRTTIIGVQRDWADGGDTGGGNAGGARDVTLDLGRAMYVYDFRNPGPPQHVAKVALKLSPVEPVILAVAPAPVARAVLAGPERVRTGSVAAFRVSRAGDGAAQSIVHIEAVAPDGTVDRARSANLVETSAGATWRLALAGDAAPGNWAVRLIDPMGGATVERHFVVDSRPDPF